MLKKKTGETYIKGEAAEKEILEEADRKPVSAEKMIKKSERAAEKAEKKIRKEAKRIKKAEKRAVRAKRREPFLAALNKYSALMHVFLSCGVCFLIEWISRHSFVEACYFAVDRNLVFLYNSLIVYSSLTLVYIVKRRASMRAIICAFWLFLGTVNGCILAKRVSPFSYTDLKMVGELLTMQSSYFSTTEAALVVAGVSVAVLFLIIFWFKGPKYQGHTHRIAGLVLIIAVMFMIPNVTDAAVSSNILTSYFTNLAQGYKDYGFVYSFSSSVLARGMSTPDNYSEEAVREVLAKIREGSEDIREASADGATDASEANASAVLIREQPQKTAASDEQSGTEAQDSQTEDSQTKDSRAENAAGGAQDARAENTDSEEIVPGDTEDSDEEYPNIICILLESFVDPAEIGFLETSEDAIPNFRNLYDNYSSGYLEVPVVGAGTANTEFEVLTGMSMQFFGLGEIPYKTILKHTDCESIASDLGTLGYGTHVVHNNGGNFYSRANAFSMMGFDTFTCKELMDIREYTPTGDWPTDGILIGEVEKSLDYTPDSTDFVYAITVGSHGDYPTYQVLGNPEITVSGVEDEEEAYAWEYYVNMLHQVDEFIGDLISMLEKRDEKTLVVMFGDHLPTMGLTEEDMASGSLFLTKYATWNNFGMEKEDMNLTSYQFLSEILNRLDIHTGTMVTFQQNRDVFETEEEYQAAMELLQYDILYGERYVYDGEDLYPASDIVMGTQDVVISQLMEGESGKYLYIIGDNFTKWSRVYVDDTKISTTYISSKLLRVKQSKIDEGEHSIVVSQVGSSETRFRDSNEVYYTKEAEEEE